MKDTPIQKAIALVNSEILELDAERQPTRLRTLKRQREVLQSLLPYERECFEETYSDGFERPDNNYIDFKDYFYKI